MSYKNKHGLTPQQERFAQAVAAGSAQAEAHRQAYPGSKKWKPESVHQAASALMANPKVSSRVKELRDAAAEACAVTSEGLVKEIARLAFSDPRRLLDESGKLKPLQDLDDATAAAISSIEVDEYGKVKYKFWDKGAAQEKLAKYLGVYKENNQQVADALSKLINGLSGNVLSPNASTGSPGLGFDEDEAT